LNDTSARDILLQNGDHFKHKIGELAPARLPAQLDGRRVALKLVTYERDGRRAGVVIEDRIYDIENCASFLTPDDAYPGDLVTLIRNRDTSDLLRLSKRIMKLGKGKEDLPPQCGSSLDEVRLHAPIPRPGKIICLGLNYRDHAQEQNAEIPDNPLLFVKASTATIGHKQPIVIPEGSTKVDYEAELAFVVGEQVKEVKADDAEDAIFGYTCMNDVTEREMQRGDKQWFRGKSVDTFAPMGPYVVTPDEVGDPSRLSISSRLNGELMQVSSTSNLIFTPADIIRFVTRTMTLEPGDVISTGTPGGVGVFRDPPVFLKDGDVIEVIIDGIGTLSNPVVARAPH
jgi:2-keto-4-pentenoate hydratase/2-oxohepta-3-ene-1,7-dioic acid hydratase in catechol pathway